MLNISNAAAMTFAKNSLNDLNREFQGIPVFRSADLAPDSFKLGHKLTEALDMLFNSCNPKNTSTEEYASLLKQVLKDHKVIGNPQKAEILKLELSKQGFDAKRVNLAFYDKISGVKATQTHSLVLLNAEKDAQIHRPATWGANAIIIDPTLGIVNAGESALAEISNQYKLPKGKFAMDLSEDKTGYKEPVKLQNNFSTVISNFKERLSSFFA